MTQDFEIAKHLQITKRTRRGDATWVTGRVLGHRFNALVFPEHAEIGEFELERSRISKLFVQRREGGQTTAHFERGWDVRPRTEIGQAIVDYLVAHLAELVYGS